MANDAEKKKIHRNNRSLLVWGIVAIVASIVLCIILAFRAAQKRYYWQFVIGIVLAWASLGWAYYRTRPYKLDHGRGQLTCDADLSGKDTWMIDVMGLGLIESFLALWWKWSPLILLIIPFYKVYTVARELIAALYQMGVAQQARMPSAKKARRRRG